MEKFLDSNILPFFASSFKNYIKELLELNLNY